MTSAVVTRSLGCRFGDLWALPGTGDWILSQHPAGTPASGSPSGGAPAVLYRYIPAGRFWTLQALEAGIFLLLTIALVAICITVVVRSRPH